MSEDVVELRKRLAEAEEAAAVERAAAKAEAARVRAEAEAHAEARGKVWARDYLASSSERVEQRRRVRTAERAVREAMAGDPVVRALIEWQAARLAAGLVHERENAARRLVGLEPLGGSVPSSAAAWRDGVPSPEFLLRPLLRVVDEMADEQVDGEREEREAELSALLSHPGGAGDPLAGLPDGEDGPVVDPRRVEEFTTTADDGTRVVARRSLDDGIVEHFTEDGSPFRLSPDLDGLPDVTAG